MARRASEPWSTRRLTRLTHSALYVAMDEQPRVVYAAVSDEGAKIDFEDGKSGVFPAALLYAILPQAKSLQAADTDERETPQAD